MWIPATQETEGLSSEAGISYIGCTAKASDIETGHISGLGVVDLTFVTFDKIMQSTSEKVLEGENIAHATALGEYPVILGVVEHVVGRKISTVVATSITKAGHQTRTKSKLQYCK